MFDGLIGQTAVKDKLTNQLRRGTESHAHLFSGAYGMGKRTFARAFAKALLCSADGGGEGGDGEAFRPCGHCLPCRLFEGDASDDYLYLEPSGQRQISVDAVRGISEWVSIRPLYAPRKVYVIADADRMTEQAQNALLKTLEEPPSYVAAILTASNAGALLETIRSRCVPTRFSLYSHAEISAILSGPAAEGYGAGDGGGTADGVNDVGDGGGANDRARRDFLARLADGVPGRAIELSQSEEFFALRDRLIDLFCAYVGGDTDDAGGGRAFFLLSSFLEKNREHFSRLADVLILWLRDMWLCTVIGTNDGAANAARGPWSAALINSDKLGLLARLRGRFRPDALFACIERIDAMRASVAANANFSLAVNAMLIKINELRKDLDLK